MHHADMTCAAFFWIAVASTVLFLLQILMCTLKRRTVDELTGRAQDMTSLNLEQRCRHRVDLDKAEDPQPDTKLEEPCQRFSSSSSSSSSSSEAFGLCACGRSTCACKTNDSTLLQAKQQMSRRQHPRRAKLQSSSEASGLCACGRSTCARKTNDSTLLQAKQQISLRRAKLQSAARTIDPCMSVSSTGFAVPSNASDVPSSSDWEGAWSSSSLVSNPQTWPPPHPPTPVAATPLAHSTDGLSTEEYDSDTDDTDEQNAAVSGRDTRRNRFCRI